MGSFSEWKKIDLHIHSNMSNLVKPNDYKRSKYDVKKLLDILTRKENNIGFFSITDHNCINYELYKNLQLELQDKEYSNKINYIIGVELDVFDEKIHNDTFHCLCFFDNNL